MTGDNPPAEETAADIALALMRDWQWFRYDMDMKSSIQMLSLHEVISQLAMDGLSKPQEAVLALLYEGRLTAQAEWRWQKFEDGEHFQREESYGIIKPGRWAKLADLLDDKTSHAAGAPWGSPTVNLENLAMLDCDRADWAFRHDRFCTAVREPEDESLPVEYEEWFSACGIQVCPRFLFEPDTPPEAPADAIVAGNSPGTVADDVSPAREMGGRPAAAEWERAALEMAGRFYTGDLKPQSIADVSRALTDWLAAQDVHPAQSTIRIHAKLIFEAIKSWDAD